MTSTRKRLESLTADLVVPEQRQAPSTAALPVETRFPPVMPGVPATRTGPGQMLAFRGQMLEVEGEVAALRDKLARYDGALPTRKLDAQSVRRSRWANRHESAFQTPEFARLKADIELAHGNVQPILVRPLQGQADQYELVFGHRRHQACQELGLPVLAAIWTEPLSDAELFAAMDRENRERTDLSAYEQGAMYQRALDESLYQSQRRLAESLGVSHTWVRKAIAVAQLPPAVVECFRSPLEIQYRHADLIGVALEKDRKQVLRRAEKLRALERPRTATAVVSALVGTSTETAEPTHQPLEVGGKQVGRWSKDRAGRLNIQIDSAHLDDDGHLVVLKSIEAALKR